ncbi:hypothetical protein K2173_025532 [Erythroxylum novogranatense]|uniref:Phytocyanin domain-containing protein n=1 Tax=Erythroxylum novogranatense TaxID=1862640 RepID=A0AAV8T8M0_9ROSI|nr:hypothetical protein K2173_025532 [Erythroxylum novogranatense]
MASPSVYVVALALIAAIAGVTTEAKEFVVGDETGWTINFDYKTWATGKDFRVGDKLIFKYPVGKHTVIPVNGTEFQNCIKPAATQPLTTGNDTIILKTAGNKWYICGVAQHCAQGAQKLAITVKPSWGWSEPPSIAPSPSYHVNAPWAAPKKRPFVERSFPRW